MKNQVWILFSVANDYNQPNKAFEELFWEQPDSEDLKKLGIHDEMDISDILKGRRTRVSGADYWIEKIKR